MVQPRYIYSHRGHNNDHDGNGTDVDYEIEGGLYCDRIPVVPDIAMTLLFTHTLLYLIYCDVIHCDTGAQHCDDLMAACLRRNP